MPIDGKSDGITLRQSIEQAAKTLKVPFEELHPRETEFPEELIYLWEYFQAASRGRPSGFGISGLPAAEIKSWADLRGLTLSPWEYEVITSLDAVTVKEANARSRRTKPSD